MLEATSVPIDHPEGCGCGSVTYDHRRADLGPITVLTQPLEPFILEALDRIAPSDLPEFRFEATLRDLRRRLARELAAGGFGPTWLLDWIVDNIHFQARLFAELTGSGRMAVRLDALIDDGCPRFHVDNVRYRLLCTLRGPGTEWLDPRATAAGLGEDAVPAGAIRRLERGAIALLRGGLGATPTRPGLLHRSPHIEGTGIARLLLVIDDADG